MTLSFELTIRVALCSAFRRLLWVGFRVEWPDYHGSL